MTRRDQLSQIASVLLLLQARPLSFFRISCGCNLCYLATKNLLKFLEGRGVIEELKMQPSKGSRNNWDPFLAQKTYRGRVWKLTETGYELASMFQRLHDVFGSDGLPATTTTTKILEPIVSR